MGRTLTNFSRQYATALRRHLRPGRTGNLCVAQALGRRAESLHLETLDVARIHDRAVAGLMLTSDRPANGNAAAAFFAEAIIPIEETHRATLKVNLSLDRLRAKLATRTADLAASQRSLQADIRRRKAVQRVLEQSSAHARQLLRESRRLQNHLQRLTHQLLTAQELKRKRISHNLHDEIAQTLLGIHIRLLTLKKEAELNAAGLRKEIVSTRQLVDKSVRSIKLFAREFGIRHKT